MLWLVDEVTDFLLADGSLLRAITAGRLGWLVGLTTFGFQERAATERAHRKKTPTHMYGTFITGSPPRSLCTSAPRGAVINKRPGETLRWKYSLCRPHPLAHQGRNRLHNTHTADVEKKNSHINTLIRICTALLCEVAAQSLHVLWTDKAAGAQLQRHHWWVPSTKLWYLPFMLSEQQDFWDGLSRPRCCPCTAYTF